MIFTLFYVRSLMYLRSMVEIRMLLTPNRWM